MLIWFCRLHKIFKTIFMKKIIFTLIILFSLNGFSQFGIKVNYASYNLKASFEGISADETADGFGVGLDYAFELGATTLIAGLNADFLSSDGESETVILSLSSQTLYETFLLFRIILSRIFLELSEKS